MATISTISLGVLLIVLGGKFDSTALKILGWCVLGFVLLIAVMVFSAFGALFGVTLGG